MMSTAKAIQFANLSGLTLCGENENEPEYIGTQQQWREYLQFQAKDDRGEFYEGYPWSPITF